MDKFSHIDKKGSAAMVDVSGKTTQLRTAIAKGSISLNDQTVSLIRDNNMKKGDVFSVARIAGIQAAKQTSNMIPLCHPLMLDKIDVKIELAENAARVKSTVVCTGRTGVEMEALTAVSVALLTIYDMCKAVDKTMQMDNITLVEKVKKDV
jgi:cyclic pyranopterin phosphate synthase